MEEPSWREKFLPVRSGASLADFPGKPGNMVVIAPHPDDDVLGTGGTMIEAAEDGKAVFSVYLTDGAGSPRAAGPLSDEEMAARRREEALAALTRAGAAGGFFLGRRSAELETEAEFDVERELGGILQWLTPTEVYLPAPYERHRTHQAATRIALRVLRAAADPRPVLLGYSVWGCFHGGKRRIARDITTSIRKKVEAVLAHSTQIAYKPYHQGILGKNNAEAVFWESRSAGKASFIETFLEMTEFLEREDLTVEQFIREDFESFLRSFSSPINETPPSARPAKEPRNGEGDS